MLTLLGITEIVLGLLEFICVAFGASPVFLVFGVVFVYIGFMLIAIDD